MMLTFADVTHMARAISQTQLLVSYLKIHNANVANYRFDKNMNMPKIHAIAILVIIQLNLNIRILDFNTISIKVRQFARI